MTDLGAFMDANKAVHDKLNMLIRAFSVQSIVLALGIILGAAFLHRRGVK